MLARKSLLIFLTNLVGGAAGAVALFFVARYMTPGALGMFGFATSLAMLGSFVASLGLERAHVKRVSEGRDLAACIGTFARLKLVLTALFAVLFAAAAWAWGRWRGFTDATTLPVLMAALGASVLVNVRQVGEQTFNALQHTARTQAMLLAEHVTRVPLVILVAAVFGAANGRWVPAAGTVRRLVDRLPFDRFSEADGAFLLGLAYLLAMAASVAAAVWLLRRHHYPVGRFDPGLARSYAAFAAPVAVLSVVGNLPAHLDKLFLGFFWSAREVGEFFAVQRLVGIVLAIPIAVQTLFFPLLSELAARREQEGARIVSASTMRALTLVMAGVALALVVFAPEIVHVFLSDAYLPAAPALRWLALYALIQGAGTVPYALLLGYDRPGWTMRIGLGNVALNLVLNLVFIPTSLLGVPLLGWGVTGAAVATVLAEATTLTVLLVASRRLVGGSPLGRPSLLHLLAAAAAGLLALAAKAMGWLPDLDRVWGLALGGALALALYVGLLVLLGELRRGDALLALDLAHPGRMAQYIRDELKVRKP